MAAMNPDAILGKVCASLDILTTVAERYRGLFPSVLDLETHEMPPNAPEPIKGQRSGDRSFPGNNLMHDEPTLRTLYALSPILGRPEYAAADACLERFATYCTDTPNGLFPWGEHAFWDLVEDRLNPGAIHDHLRQAPVWLWERLWEINPCCVERFAEGLECHWTEGEPREYSRHAPMDARRPAERHGSRSCDFPRHSGFYILDLTFAWLKTRRPEFHAHIRRPLDYWWEKRFPDGLLLSESRSPEGLRPFEKVKGPARRCPWGSA